MGRLREKVSCVRFWAGVLVRFPGALLLGGALADDVGRVVAFESGSLELFDAPTSRAMSGGRVERGWRTRGQGQSQGRRGKGKGGRLIWRGTHLPFSLSSLSLMCFERFLNSRLDLTLSVSMMRFSSRCLDSMSRQPS